MVLPRSYRSEGVVLESRPQGEANLLVTLLARDKGKLKAIAKGARKLTSRMVGHLEPLTRVELALARGRDLDIVTQSQVVESFQPLKANLEGVSRGLYLAELVNEYAAQGVANLGLYNLLLDTLRLLPASCNPDLTMRHFELHLLKLSGFMPELYRCVECSATLSPGEHQFSAEIGGTVCSRCRPVGVGMRFLSLEALKVLRYLDRAELPQLDRLRLERDQEDEVSGLLSSVLSYWLDREVRSRKFLEHVQSAGSLAR